MNRKLLIVLIGLIVSLAGLWFVYNKYRVVTPAVDVSRSEIGWSGKSISGAHMGKINLKKAELQFQNDKLVGGMFEADMNSISVSDISDPEENKSLIEHFANEDFFEIKRFPTASYRITGVKALENDLYQVSGVMKIKEKEQPVEFEARVTTIEGGGHRASATVAVDRTRFGIEYAAKDKPGSEKDWFIFNEIMLNINIVTEN